jgi:protein required for attachment to host cells
MKKKVTWILIADGTRARILKNEGPGKGLHPAIDGEFHHEAPRTHEIGTDRPGRTKESANTTRHAMEQSDWHRFEKEKFAKEMAQVLERAEQAGAYDRLILVAPPKTLGDLRGALADPVRKKVTGEIGKDLTPMALGEMPAHLEAVLAV